MVTRDVHGTVDASVRTMTRSVAAVSPLAPSPLAPSPPSPSVPPSQSFMALSSQTLRAARRAVDCPLDLDDEQLLEIVQSFHHRAGAVGVVGATAMATIAVVLTPMLWFVSLALMPAAIGGVIASNRAMGRASASRFGVTPACLRQIEVTFDEVSRRRDLRTLSAWDWVRTDWGPLVQLLRAELVRKQQGLTPTALDGRGV